MAHKIRKNKHSYTFYDMYQEMPLEVPYLTYKRVLTTMCSVILEHVLMRSEGFKMPYGLGYITVAKYQPKQLNKKSLSVDFKSSKEFGKTVYHLNEHSDGYKYRLYWSKVPQTFPDRYKYQLQFVRENKRKLAQLIFNRKDYADINDIQVYKM